MLLKYHQNLNKGSGSIHDTLRDKGHEYQLGFSEDRSVDRASSLCMVNCSPSRITPFGGEGGGVFSKEIRFTFFAELSSLAKRDYRAIGAGRTWTTAADRAVARDFTARSPGRT